MVLYEVQNESVCRHSWKQDDREKVRAAPLNQTASSTVNIGEGAHQRETSSGWIRSGEAPQKEEETCTTTVFAVAGCDAMCAPDFVMQNAGDAGGVAVASRNMEPSGKKVIAAYW